MKFRHRDVVNRWHSSIVRAIELGEAGAACKLTIGLVRRLRELGALKLGE